MAVVVKNLSEETKTYIYEVSSEKGFDNEREFDATSIYKREVIGGVAMTNKLVWDTKFQIGTFESMAWHPNEENVLFVSSSEYNEVFFQAKNIEDSESLFDYKYFHRPKLSVGKRHAFKKIGLSNSPINHFALFLQKRLEGFHLC